jgi:hypothetical protein
MNDQRRYGSDYDNLRNLREGQRPANGGADPLAELERLVSEGEARTGRQSARPVRQDPRIHYEDEPAPAGYHGHDHVVAEAEYFGRNDPRGYQQGEEFDFPQDEAYAQHAGYYGEADDYHQQAYEQPAPKRRSGTFTVMTVIGLAVLGGAGAVAYSMLDGGDTGSGDGNPPLIEASRDPAKTTPESGGNEVPHQNKQIYDRVGSAPAGSAKIVGGAEEPGERPVGTYPDTPQTPLPGENGGPEPLPLDNAAPTVPGARKVRTIAIRPDGSFAEPLSGAPAESARPAEPTGPIVGTGEVDRGMSMERGPEFGIMTSEGAADAASPNGLALVPMPMARPGGLQAQAAPVNTLPAQVSTPAPAAAPAVSAAPAAAAPSAVRAPANQTINKKRELRPPPIPAGQQRPAGQRSSLSSPATTASIAPASLGGAGFSVQLTAQSSEALAQSEFSNMQRRYPSLLSGRQPSIVPVSIPDRGTFYRVRVNTGTQAEASNLCSSLKAAGADCLVQRNT